MARVIGATLLVSLCACATVPARPPPPRPVARSSIDALLVHAAELRLTDAQQTQLRDFDDVREVKALELTRELRERTAVQRSAAEEAGGGMRRGGGRGQRHQGGREGPHGPPALRTAIEGQLDELDTRAYLEAEAVLTDTQREPARTFASGYRAALFDWRHATRNTREP